MKTIRAVAAVIRKKDNIFTIVKGNGIIKTNGSFPAERLKKEKLLSKP